ncbi:MAG: hypothetical protein HKN70_12980 [Gammaproteobacteria bacterium]|nr:hypothetical protein [Gammaproteobacteria bacterium]
MRKLIMTGLVLAIIGMAPTASAFPQYLLDWLDTYNAISTSGSDADCQLCHAGAFGGSPWNAYGFDLIVAFDQMACDSDNNGAVSSVETFRCVEFFNSDGDTGEHDNITEILGNTQPGWTNGDCNTHYSSVSTAPGQPAPINIGTIDPAGTAPLTGCDTDPTDPVDPGDATIVTVSPGESIQAALNAVGPGSTVLIEPGIYTEDPDAQNALSITKSGIRLIGLSDGDSGVVIQGNGANRNGIVAVPVDRTDCLSCHASLAPPFSLWPDVPSDLGDTSPVIHGLEIRNITIEGFINNGLFTERVDDFKIINVHSVDNRNYGIFPTLSSNGLIKNSSATGADDSGIWIETSTDVDVIDNLSAGNVNGFEVSNSSRIRLVGNESTNNTVGMSLFVLTDLVDERPGTNKIKVSNNWVHNNNKPNSGTPGSLLSILDPGFGILLLGVDHSVIENNLIENNDGFGVAIADYCLGVLGTSFDCTANPPPPEFDSTPRRNQVSGNTLINNGTNPTGPFASFAADITMFVLGDYGNCLVDNTLETVFSFIPLRTCSALSTPYMTRRPTVP